MDDEYVRTVEYGQHDRDDKSRCGRVEGWDNCNMNGIGRKIHIEANGEVAMIEEGQF